MVNGEGFGIVTRTGDNTFLGNVNTLMTQTDGTQTTLERDINLFIKVVAIIAVTMAVVLFTAGTIRFSRRSILRHTIRVYPTRSGAILEAITF